MSPPGLPTPWSQWSRDNGGTPLDSGASVYPSVKQSQVKIGTSFTEKTPGGGVWQDALPGGDPADSYQLTHYAPPQICPWPWDPPSRHGLRTSKTSLPAAVLSPGGQKNRRLSYRAQAGLGGPGRPEVPTNQQPASIQMSKAGGKITEGTCVAPGPCPVVTKTGHPEPQHPWAGDSDWMAPHNDAIKPPGP